MTTGRWRRRPSSLWQSCSPRKSFSAVVKNKTLFRVRRKGTPPRIWFDCGICCQFFRTHSWEPITHHFGPTKPGTELTVSCMCKLFLTHEFALSPISEAAVVISIFCRRERFYTFKNDVLVGVGEGTAFYSINALSCLNFLTTWDEGWLTHSITLRVKELQALPGSHSSCSPTGIRTWADCKAQASFLLPSGFGWWLLYPG